jgi:hypothetical protein
VAYPRHTPSAVRSDRAAAKPHDQHVCYLPPAAAVTSIGFCVGFLIICGRYPDLVELKEYVRDQALRVPLDHTRSRPFLCSRGLTAAYVVGSPRRGLRLRPLALVGVADSRIPTTSGAGERAEVAGRGVAPEDSASNGGKKGTPRVARRRR